MLPLRTSLSTRWTTLFGHPLVRRCTQDILRRLQALLNNARQKRWINLGVVNLRILLGFAFVPAGLKKILHQPFTDPANTGLFHEFLHVFYATGAFYQFVGVVQLLIALLLMTQTFATLGAFMALPVITAITVFCWSTWVVPTAIVATLMWCGTLFLVIWDIDKWRGLIRADRADPSDRADQTGAAPTPAQSPLPIDVSLWQRCGLAVLGFYGAICALSGGIYRPKGPEPDNPAFYLFPLIVLFPLVTFAIEQQRRRRKNPT